MFILICVPNMILGHYVNSVIIGLKIIQILRTQKILSSIQYAPWISTVILDIDCVL